MVRPIRRRRAFVSMGVVAALCVASLAGADAVAAKAKAACKAGSSRNKAGKCVKVKKNATAPKATTTTVKKATGAVAAKGTIKLGTLYSSVSSTGTKTLEEARKIAEVWVDDANRNGGINGYKIDLIARDTRNDQARGLAAIKEMESQGVLAIVGHSTAAQLPGAAKLLEQKSFPVIGGQPYLQEYDDHPMFFQTSSSLYAGVYSHVAAARDAGAKNYRSLSCSEVAACSGTDWIRSEAGPRENVKVTNQLASAVAPDYTSYCLSAKGDGVDFLQGNGVPLANIVRDCSRQNYHPIYAQGGAANQAVIDATKGEQVYGSLFEWGIFYNGPEVQGFRKALAKTDMNLTSLSPAGQESVQAWLGWEMAGAIIKKLTKPNPTRADFLEATYSIKGESLGGQIAPMDYSVQRPGTGLHAAQDCWTEHTVKDGAFYHINTKGQIVDRLTFICGTGKTYKIKSYL